MGGLGGQEFKGIGAPGGVLGEAGPTGCMGGGLRGWGLQGSVMEVSQMRRAQGMGSWGALWDGWEVPGGGDGGPGPRSWELQGDGVP